MRIGSAYSAEAFPLPHVRAMILDAVSDSNADPIEADLRQAKGFQDAFNDYAADRSTEPPVGHPSGQPSTSITAWSTHWSTRTT